MHRRFSKSWLRPACASRGSTWAVRTAAACGSTRARVAGFEFVPSAARTTTYRAGRLEIMAIRVLVVDDSAFMRRVVSEAIAAQPDMEVAGVAINGLDALVKVEQLQPDVVTLDVEMPDMDGLTALRHLMARYPRPVVMLSTMTQDGAVTTLRALSIGAVDFVAKPSAAISLDFHRVKDELLHKIRVAAKATARGAVVSGSSVVSG